MKGNPDIIKLLNEVLRKELTGINQYFIHSKMCRNWGYEVLAKVHWKESIDEMQHADRIVERIIFLEGVPNVQAYDKIQVGSNVRQQLHNDHHHGLHPPLRRHHPTDSDADLPHQRLNDDRHGERLRQRDGQCRSDTR